MKSLRLPKPHLLVVVGIPGSGKTFFASQFAEMFHIPYINYNELQSVTDEPLSEDATAGFAGILFRELTKTGQSILIEGPGASRTERTALTAQARKNGYDTIFIWVQTDPVASKKRATKTIHGSSYQPISEEVFEQETKRFSALHPTEKPLVISGRHTYASQARIVLKRLVEPAVETRQVAPAPARPERRPGRISIN